MYLTEKHQKLNLNVKTCFQVQQRMSALFGQIESTNRIFGQTDQ